MTKKSWQSLSPALANGPFTVHFREQTSSSTSKPSHKSNASSANGDFKDLLLYHGGFAAQGELSLNFKDTWISPVLPDPGISESNTGNYKNISGKKHTGSLYIPAWILATKLQFQKSHLTLLPTPSPANSSLNTSQILSKLFFPANQMGDRNQFKGFVQFLALYMLAIKLMPDYS